MVYGSELGQTKQKLLRARDFLRFFVRNCVWNVYGFFVSFETEKEE